MKRASAGALAAQEDEQHDTRQDPHGTLADAFQVIANEVGDDLTDDEASKVRGLLRRGLDPAEIIRVVHFIRDLTAA